MVPHHKVQDVLNRGHIFINTSIAEAFCIAVLEAVACGLKVVSTNVGGIPEILPEDMLLLCDPNCKSLIKQLDIAMQTYKNFSPSEFNRRIAKYYSWRNVAERVETLYEEVLDSEQPSVGFIQFEMLKTWSHYIYWVGLLLNTIMKFILNFFCPVDTFETAIDFNFSTRYNSTPDLFGDHDFKVTDPTKLNNKNIE